MKPKSRTLRHDHGHKNETDRYELDWHEISDCNGEYTVRKTVWTNNRLFNCDSNHIDLYDKRENRGVVIMSESGKALNFKFKNTQREAKFEP